MGRPKSTTLGILTGARKRLEKGWVQRAYNMQIAGVASYCILGAVCAETGASVWLVNAGERRYKGARAVQILNRISRNKCGMSAMVFNDTPERTLDEVLGLVDEAIKSVKEKSTCETK